LYLFLVSPLHQTPGSIHQPLEAVTSFQFVSSAGCKVGLWFNFLVVACYFKGRCLERRERRPGGSDLPVPPSLLEPSSLFCWVNSSSMVISTRPEPSSPPPPTLSVSWMMVCCFCLGCNFVASTWRTGWSSMPQPLPVSYFLSLRDSCFFFSEAAAFTLEGSAGGAGPCERRGERG
ncbi:hypothetical protein GOODEAATRI_002197, partial [Goodea atripinnis]